MRIVHEQGPLREFRTGVLVPTMGALHEGHAALIRLAGSIARAEPDRPPVVVTVFVNPTQFNDPRDFTTYPRTLEADCALAERAGADCVFAPSVEEVYPPPHAPGGAPERPIDLPAAATHPGLEDAHRPGHFAGVCRVCSRLFDLTDPRAAVFGEKDWQQLQVVRAMVRAQGRTLRIVPHETVREPDGLAMSSRNVRLSPEARTRALSLWAAIRAAQGETSPGAAEAAGVRSLRGAGIVPEYFVVREAESLDAPRAGRACRTLVAAAVGGVRLIDNAPWPGPPPGTPPGTPPGAPHEGPGGGGGASPAAFGPGSDGALVRSVLAYQGTPTNSSQIEPPIELEDSRPRSPTGPIVTPQMGESNTPQSRWVFLNGEWVQTFPTAPGAQPGPGASGLPDGADPTGGGTDAPPAALVTQRVIEVPVAPLLQGVAQYNIVIRPGDVISVPSPPQGVIYVSGPGIQRPGTYNLPFSGKLTLQRLVASAGGLSAVAIPERVDLVRMIGENRQATIRVDYKAISAGTQPDILLKPDDLLNFGTNFWATPAAVIRNGFRMSYGFGFLLDRNFGNDVFGPPPDDNNFN